VLSEELLAMAVGPVEKIKMMASNAMDHEAIMASVRACCEEIASILDMKAGTLMSMAASIYVAANEESIQGQTTGISEETVKQQRMTNTSQVTVHTARSEAERTNESWDEARERLNTAMMMCRTNMCPAWLKESSYTLKSIKKRSRTLIQTMEGHLIRNGESEVRMVTQDDTVMAVIRLITASVQHCETQKAPATVPPTGTKHIRFSAAIGAPEETEEQEHNSTWHECEQSPEPEWHDCQQQGWSHRKQQVIAKNPGQTTSEIRRKQRERQVAAITEQHQKSMAALEEAAKEQAEEEIPRQAAKVRSCSLLAARANRKVAKMVQTFVLASIAVKMGI